MKGACIAQAKRRLCWKGERETRAAVLQKVPRSSPDTPACSYHLLLPPTFLSYPSMSWFLEFSSLLLTCLSCSRLGEKPGNEPEEVKLQNASRQIVQNAILQAVRQVSQESQRVEASSSDSRSRCQLGMGELTKKHEKK